MASDTDIDKRVLELIKQLHKTKNIFGDVDIDTKLDELLIDINKNGNHFLKCYFN